jgi:hypothetical protein
VIIIAETTTIVIIFTTTIISPPPSYHHHHHHDPPAGAPCVISVCSAPPSLLEGEQGVGSDKDRALFFTRRVACSIVAQVSQPAAV